MATKIASTNTEGVYILAHLLTFVSLLAFLSLAFSNKFSILETLLSSYFFWTFTSNRPSKLMQPDNISSPGFTATDLASPLNAWVSKLL